MIAGWRDWFNDSQQHRCLLNQHNEYGANEVSPQPALAGCVWCFGNIKLRSVYNEASISPNNTPSHSHYSAKQSCTARTRAIQVNLLHSNRSYTKDNVSLSGSTSTNYLKAAWRPNEANRLQGLLLGKQPVSHLRKISLQALSATWRPLEKYTKRWKMYEVRYFLHNEKGNCALPGSFINRGSRKGLVNTDAAMLLPKRFGPAGCAQASNFPVRNLRWASHFFKKDAFHAVGHKQRCGDTHSIQTWGAVQPVLCSGALKLKRGPVELECLAVCCKQNIKRTVRWFMKRLSLVA